MHLKELQATGKYVFHGSDSDEIAVLKPHQAYSHGKEDGEPAVFAADVIEPPIFMAVLGSRKVGGWGNRTLPGYGFYIDKASWDKAHFENWRGYVYALPKSTFTHIGAYEWRSSKAVKPEFIFEVGVEDLPKNITIRPDQVEQSSAE